MLLFEGYAKGGVERVAVGIDELVIAPEYRSEPAARLTQDETVELRDGGGGTPHVVLIGAADRLWVTVGTDHGPRKPIARVAWRFEEVEPHWGQLRLGDVPLATLRAPRDLILGWKGSKRLPVGVAMFAGAAPAGTGERFDVELVDPVLGRAIKHSYYVRRSPILA